MGVKIKSYAKLNLTLNVGRPTNGYHPIDSVVSTVDIYDIIYLSKRKDDRVRVKMRGLVGYDIKTEDNNAYKAAKAFCEKFKTTGVDIEIIKRIRIGGGLGGSSADVAGVLRGMKKLYGEECFIEESELKELADGLGSDCGYMLGGGSARISGRGEIVERLEKDLEGFAVVAYCDGGVLSRDCYSEFDKTIGEFSVADNEATTNAILNGDFATLAKNVSNGLALPAENLCSEIKKNLDEMRVLSPSACSVTGSGSCTFALYETRELCAWAADRLKKRDIDCEVVSFVSRYE